MTFDDSAPQEPTFSLLQGGLFCSFRRIMMKVPLNASTFDKPEIEAAIEVLNSGFVTMGERCFRFEDVFSKYIGIENSIFVNSGSSANLLAFFALVNHACPESRFGATRLKPGQEVIVPAVTWSTTIWPIVQAGLIPVLVDSDPKTLQMDLSSARDAITHNTGAICPVHVLGNAVSMNPILELAEKHKLWVVEDTCEALGTTYDKKFVGTIGDIGTYSFFFSHHITTIEGGMVVTNNNALAELFRCQRAHGWTRHLKGRKQIEANYSDIDPRFLFVNTGFNVRPTEINAAFGFEQLKKLAKFNEKRIKVAQYWISVLGPLIEKNVIVPMQTSEKVQSTWFGFPIMCESQNLRNGLQNHLEKNGIETRPIICGNLARQPAFKNIPHRIAGSLRGADQVMDQGLFWGSHPLMNEQEIEYVAKTVKDYFE